MPFSDLGLIQELLLATRTAGYATPTPVQHAVIPAILQGRDVHARAQTGSGKTAAFALPMLQLLSTLPPPIDRHVRGLILVPTRELAMQVCETMRTLARTLPRSTRILALAGGSSINPQMMALRGGADVVVATPGRLLDLAAHNAVRLAEVRTLVLDEADRLMDEGFADELGRVLELLPGRRQTLLFSATYPPAVQSLAERLLHDPVRVAIVEAADTTPDIEQRCILVDPERRTQLLHRLVVQHGWTRTLVFVATRYATEHVARKLRRLGLAAIAWHGDLSQGARASALADLKAGRVQVVIATDLAARGIDVTDLPAVVNFDLPRSAADYVHRIGRTGRAGARGIAVSFVSASVEAHWRLIEARNHLRVPRERLPGFEPTEKAPSPPPTGAAAGGIKGKRRSRKDRLREAAAKQVH